MSAINYVHAPRRARPIDGPPPGGADSWRRSETGLYVPPRAPAPCLRHGKPIAVEFFCGAGGMSLGLKQAGFHVAAASDSWTTAAMTYTHNLGAYPMTFHFLDDGAQDKLEKALQKEWERTGAVSTAGSGWLAGDGRGQVDANGRPIPGCEHFFLGDVRNLRGQQVLDALGLDRGDIDLVAGGPPCQGYSVAGRRDVMDPRNSLVFEFTRLIIELRPKAFIFENVPGIATMVTPEGIPVLDAMAFELEAHGFGARDALRASLAASSGAGAAVRGTTVRTRSRAPRRREVPEAELPSTRAAVVAAQSSLFDGV